MITLIKKENFISYFCLIIISIASLIYFYMKATPYAAINSLRIYCYFVLILLFISWTLIRRANIKPILVNTGIATLVLLMVIIQNYMLPELRYSEAQHLVEQTYGVDTENNPLTTIYDDKGSDLYIITGYLNGQKQLFSVHPYSKRIENISFLIE